MGNWSMAKSDYHVPVMLKECIEGLDLKVDGVYVDVTYGGGGHSKEMLRHLGRDATLVVFDQDGDAQSQVVEDSRVVFVPSNYRYLAEWLAYLGFLKVDGVLADLGVSSFQLDELDRGFSYRFEGAFDMRMNQLAERSVMEWLQTVDQSELQLVLSRYGQVRNAKTLSRAIMEVLHEGGDGAKVRRVISRCVVGPEYKYLSQVYQALRIAVNDEMAALDEFLNQLDNVVVEGGRIVVMSYHSLEDRRVKNLIKKGNAQGVLKKDEKGNYDPKWKEIIKGVLTPTDEEIKINNRARSAKLRVAEKL